MKRSFKYLLIALVNLLVLIVMLALWADALLLTFNSVTVLWELLRILGFTLLALIGMSLLVFTLRRRGAVPVRQRIKRAVLLTLILCSWLYVDYSVKLINNRVVNRTVRADLVSKVATFPFPRTLFAENLTPKEYRQIRTVVEFPELPPEASNIRISYSISGLQGDYNMEVHYDLPPDTPVDQLEHREGDLVTRRSHEVLEDRVRATWKQIRH